MEEVPNIELRIIGAREEREGLIALRDNLGPGSVVAFSGGFVPVENIPARIQDADVGIVPLRISSGLTSCCPPSCWNTSACAFHASSPGPAPSQVALDEMGEFFVAEDHKSLADGILRLYRDREHRRRLAQGATPRFGRQYSWSRHKRVYTALVADMLVGR